jgi:hypothetical protein
MKDFLVVRKSEVGVFGYKAGVLESITNESPRAVRFTICTTQYRYLEVHTRTIYAARQSGK